MNRTETGIASDCDSPPPAARTLEIIHTELSTRRRWSYRAFLVLNCGCLAALISLWATEPGPLPVRLNVAFTGLALILAGWIGVLAWILMRRDCPSALDRVATSWMALVGASFFLVIGIPITLLRGEMMAALSVTGVGMMGLVAAGCLLHQAYAKRSELREKLMKAECNAGVKSSRILPLLIVMLFHAVFLSEHKRCCAEAAIDQKSKAVIDRHLQVCGGRKQLEDIKSRRITGVLVRHGTEMPIEVLQAAPNRSLTKTFFPRPGTLVQGFDGEEAWILHPTRGSLLIEKSQRQAIADEAWIDRVLHLNDIFSSVSYERFDREANQHILAMAKPDGDTIRWHFGENSGRLESIHREVDLGPQGSAMIRTELADYRTTDGITQPWEVRTIAPRGETKLVIKTIQHNIEVSDDEFSSAK